MTNNTNDRLRPFFNDLLSAPMNLKRIARRHDLSLDALADRAIEREILRLLKSHATICDATAALGVGVARLGAIRSLTRLASSGEHPETARKAAGDLLRLSPAPLANDRSDTPTEAPIPALEPVTEASILSALESLASPKPQPTPLPRLQIEPQPEPRG